MRVNARPLGARRAQHDKSGRQRRLLETLRRQLPERDRLLSGWPEITAYLKVLGYTGYRGALAKPDTVRRWIRHHDCPIVLGFNRRRGCYSSTHALLAWALSFHDAAQPPRRSQPIAEAQAS